MVSLLWVVFTGLFGLMAWKEFRQMKKGLDVPEYNLRFSDMNEAQEILRKAIRQADRESHKIAGTSYVLATAVSGFSLVLSIQT